MALSRMQNATLAASWAAWRNYAAYSGSAKRTLLIATARLQNRTLSKAWLSWRSYTEHSMNVKAHVRPVLEAHMRGLKWSTMRFWAGWANDRVSLRVLAKEAQETRRQRMMRQCFAAWLQWSRYKTGGERPLRVSAQLPQCQ